MSEIAPPQSTVPEAPQLTGPQRAAIILSLLEPDKARAMAERFDAGSADRAVEAFESLPMIGKDDLLSVIGGYLDALSGNVPLVAGGPLRAEELARALIPPAFEPMTEDFEFETEAGSIEEGADAEEVWAYIRELSPDKLAALLIAERPAMISAVLAQLSKEGASAVLSALPDEKASDVVRLILRGRKPSAKTYDAIAEALRRVAPERLEATTDEGFVPSDVAGIFNRMPAARQNALLNPIKPDMPEEIEALEQHLLSFPNLDKRLPKTVVPTVFREIDESILDPALSYALAQGSDIAEFLLSSISQRLAEQIRERIEEKPKVSVADGEEAQAELMRKLIEWVEEGRFSFKFPDPDE